MKEGPAPVLVVSSVLALVGGVVWLCTVVAGFLALAKARTPAPGVVEPVSTLAITAAIVALGSAFLGPGVVVGQVVAIVLGLIARNDASPASRVLARWVVIWALTLLSTVFLIAFFFFVLRPVPPPVSPG